MRRTVKSAPSRRAAVAIALAVAGSQVRSAHAILTSDVGLDLSQVIGANTFYNAGYTGTDAIIANIEMGYVWDGAGSPTQKVTTYFSDPTVDNSTANPIPDLFDRHATWVGSLLAGNGGTTQSNGIAYNATLWSGAIAQYWVSAGTGNYSESFDYSMQTFTTAYTDAMISGFAGKTADVINSSWSGSGGLGGLDQSDLELDSLIYQSGKVVVLAAGNSGPHADTVISPATGLNTIVVGGLIGDNSTPVYGSAINISSRSPSDLYIPTDAAGTDGTYLTGVRSLVDITAPAANLTLFQYDGATGGNTFGGPSDNSITTYTPNSAGTSFSSPIVAAGAALIVDAGKQLFPTDSHAIDGRVIKAVLLNSASKPVGWNNGQTVDGSGVISTEQSLDYIYGAGILNLTAGYPQYTAGTTDVTGPSGVAVQSVGWAYGTITHNPSATATFDYDITGTLRGGSTFSVTLTWFADEPDNSTALQYGSFDNLYLEVFQDSGGVPTTLIAQSDSLYNSTQELYFTLPATGAYSIRVLEDNYVYNFNGDTTTPYGLAWSATPVPEPTSIGLLLMTALPLLARRRRR
jgi:hypothetical protein